MPFSYSIHPEENLIREKFSGAITVVDLRAILLEERADPQYRKLMHSLSDFTAARSTISEDDMHAYVAFLAKVDPVDKQAIVVATQLGQGLARMFQLLTEHGPKLWNRLKVFSDVNEAERWIASD